MKFTKIFLLAAILVAATSLMANADVKQLKVYRQAFPDLKPSCTYCHVDKIPKKGDGEHELNAYGMKALELAQEAAAEEAKEEALPTEDIYTGLGSHEDFVPEEEGEEGEDMEGAEASADEDMAEPKGSGGMKGSGTMMKGSPKDK